jgi:hypothetical protein
VTVTCAAAGESNGAAVGSVLEGKAGNRNGTGVCGESEAKDLDDDTNGCNGEDKNRGGAPSVPERDVESGVCGDIGGPVSGEIGGILVTAAAVEAMMVGAESGECGIDTSNVRGRGGVEKESGVAGSMTSSDIKSGKDEAHAQHGGSDAARRDNNGLRRGVVLSVSVVVAAATEAASAAVKSSPAKVSRRW